MENTQLNIVDLAVFAIILLSALLAVFRGFVRELLSLSAWVGATLITIWCYPLVRPWMHKQISSELGADIASGLGLFCLSLAILIPIGYFISSLIRGRALTAIDRSLGFVFGIARGALIVCLIFLITLWIWPEQNKEPQMLAKAHTRPYMATGAEALKGFLPKEDVDKISASMRNMNKPSEAISLEKLTTPSIAGAKPADATTTGMPSGMTTTVTPVPPPASVPTPPPTPPPANP
jgi:membrane protein required for colicin V production